ncbi:hypothetical protein [Sandarakinorhabdus sp. DWP1-3-1]|uniref:hypothetical protein n=1 Tax=Sandarakinorhabdus sp. DWP1-3-1 TaxID=2804627 RepID=UPI003CF09D9B
MLARATVMRNCRLIVEQVALSPGNAGSARMAALDRAIFELPPTGIVMTTDADSEVAPDWIMANLAEIDAGADAVAVVVAFSPATLAALPSFGSARHLEWQLADQHARLGTLIDPVAHDPWPNHIWAWGASLAVTVAAYRTVGGMPPVPLAVDRAFAARIEAHDLRLRRSHAAVVYTSARRSGRAPGGFADLIDAYASNAEMPCDAALEPTMDLVRRLLLRARCRAAGENGFGARWAMIESTTPALARRRLHPATLPAEVALAGRIIAALSPAAAGRADTPVSAPGV